LRVAADIEEAIAELRDATPDDVVFVTGSLFLVAEARAALVAKCSDRSRFGVRIPL
jgi:hypothetical protein